ncbi:MAG: NUDIX domain-containing protein [Sporichthyaceae bacterium]
MNRRIDYLDDPNAPAPNSLVPSVTVIVEDGAGRILTIERTDNDWWSVPGGAIELGESIAQAAVRETEEETGIVCEVVGLIGVHSDPGHLIHYTSNDEVRQEFTIMLLARPVGGALRTSDESSRVEWLDPHDFLARLLPEDSLRRRVEDYLAGPSTWPRIG